MAVMVGDMEGEGEGAMVNVGGAVVVGATEGAEVGAAVIVGRELVEGESEGDLRDRESVRCRENQHWISANRQEKDKSKLTMWATQMGGKTA